MGGQACVLLLFIITCHSWSFLIKGILKNCPQSFKSSKYNYRPIEYILLQEKSACSSPVPAHNLPRYLRKSTVFAPLRQVYQGLIGDLQLWRIMKSRSDAAFFCLPWKASNVVFLCITSSGRDYSSLIVLYPYEDTQQETKYNKNCV